MAVSKIGEKLKPNLEEVIEWLIPKRKKSVELYIERSIDKCRKHWNFNETSNVTGSA